jgi:hypothetical protein
MCPHILTVRDGFEYERLSLMEENPMNKIFYFLMVSVAFTGLQVGTVEAADASCAKLADGSLPPHCQTDSNAADHESAGLVNSLPAGSVMHNETGHEGEGTKMGFAPAPQDHKVGQERWDPAMGGKGTPTMHDDQTTGMKAPHQSPR